MQTKKWRTISRTNFSEAKKMAKTNTLWLLQQAATKQTVETTRQQTEVRTKKNGKKLNKRFGEWVRNNKKTNWIVPIHSECCQSSNAQSTNDTKREKNQNCINVTVYTASNNRKNSQNLKSETLIQVQRKQHGKLFSDGDCVWLWVAHNGKSTVLVGLTNCTVCVQSLRLASSECGCCRTHASRCVLCGRTPSPNILPMVQYTTWKLCGGFLWRSTAVRFAHACWQTTVEPTDNKNSRLCTRCICWIAHACDVLRDDTV